MKKILVIIVACLSVALSHAQEDSPFYVYRNDGDFNAFFLSEVDSITYSSIDIDSIQCEDVVTQEFWTSDSVYRIPLAAIDSVGFTTNFCGMWRSLHIKLCDSFT